MLAPPPIYFTSMLTVPGEAFYPGGQLIAASVIHVWGNTYFWGYVCRENLTLRVETSLQRGHSHVYSVAPILRNAYDLLTNHCNYYIDVTSYADLCRLIYFTDHVTIVPVLNLTHADSGTVIVNWTMSEDVLDLVQNLTFCVDVYNESSNLKLPDSEWGVEMTTFTVQLLDNYSHCHNTRFEISIPDATFDATSNPVLYISLNNSKLSTQHKINAPH